MTRVVVVAAVARARRGGVRARRANACCH
jgi:hypothetical protein